ncbi:MAG TPA: glycoside hydrolase family 43 protein [Acidimicrobiia bacterium]|nr:glycoside hydrolase family 43 protein [Acidimicrobiia bacterium]
MILSRSFRERTPFPGQDPFVVPHDGAFLLIQAARNDRRIVIKRFAELGEMHRNTQTTIWKPLRGSRRGRQLWAPELHEIDGRWYVYYAASDGQNENHRMYVLEADRPLGPYHSLGQIGDPHHDTWAIDMTVLRHDGRLYAVWSGWEGEHDGFPQHLYIAPMADPATISGERVRISSPELDWEQRVAPLNEGPQVLRNERDGKLFIAFSADASWSPEYKVGLLEWTGGPLLDSASWTKRPEPLLTGGGHGCFIEADGRHWFVYHRKLSADPGWADREIRVEPFTWDADGYPVLESQRRTVDLTAGPESPAEGLPVSGFASASGLG